MDAQYKLGNYLWPEVEVNSSYYRGGANDGKRSWREVYLCLSHVSRLESSKSPPAYDSTVFLSAALEGTVGDTRHLIGEPVAHASFKGLRVLSLESRRAKEIEKLIRTYGGEAIVVPAMREVGLDSNAEALEFAEGLLRGEFDLVIFMTGVGVRTMLNIVQTRFDGEEFLAALRKVKIAARGAKPATALRELKVPLHVVSDEPSTWRELLRAIDEKLGARSAIFLDCDVHRRERIAIGLVDCP